MRLSFLQYYWWHVGRLLNHIALVLICFLLTSPENLFTIPAIVTAHLFTKDSRIIIAHSPPQDNNPSVSEMIYFSRSALTLSSFGHISWGKKLCVIYVNNW